MSRGRKKNKEGWEGGQERVCWLKPVLKGSGKPARSKVPMGRSLQEIIEELKCDQRISEVKRGGKEWEKKRLKASGRQVKEVNQIRSSSKEGTVHREREQGGVSTESKRTGGLSEGGEKNKQTGLLWIFCGDVRV